MSASPLFPRIAAALLALFLAGMARADLKVATLHPLLTDVARQVGGKTVTVVALAPAGTDMHHFSPTPADVKKLAGAQLVLASGKHMENYLDKLRDNLMAGQEIVEVGRTIPSIKIDASDSLFMCCPEHAQGAIDPHWWNSVENMQRAGRVVTDLFSQKDPANADAYRANAAAWNADLDGLKKWARKEISAIPSGRRKLATSHLALSYFAKEFGFKLVPIQGLSPEVKATSQDIAKAIETIKKNGVTAVFPENGVNPKNLKEMAAETGVKFGGELIADGNGAGELEGFRATFRHNVDEIVKALK